MPVRIRGDQVRVIAVEKLTLVVDPWPDEHRNRHRIEAGIPALCSSVDGRHLTFQASLHGLELQPGGYVAVGEAGSVRCTLEHAWLDAGTLDGIDAAQYGVRRVGVARGDGVVLEGDGALFHDEPLAPASAAAVSDWIERTRPQRASLDVGALVLEPSVHASAWTPAASTGTFFCGQSGSGKTYALGTVLERLLETSLRIVVLDPNSDFVRLGQPRADVAPDVADRYRAAATGLAIRRSGDDSERLHVRFVDCDAAEQAAVLGSTRFATVTSTALWWNSWRPGHRRAGMGPPA